VNSEIPFGIGCFHFGINKAAPYAIKWSKYLSELERALSAISGLGQLVMEDRTIEDFEIKVDKELPVFGESYDFVPYFNYLELAFDLHIPFAEQEKLNPWPGGQKSFYTEDYRVYIYATYYGLPIAFIELVDPKPNSSPSDAVFIVREFLSEQINKRIDSFINFNILGPSPFHADLFIEVNNKFPQERSDNFIISEEISHGYGRVSISFNSQSYDSVHAAAESFFFNAKRELGLFYLIILLQNAEDKQWWNLFNSVANLSKKLQSLWLKRLFLRPSKKVYEIVSALSAFEIIKIRDTDQIKDHYRNVYSSQVSYLKWHIDDLTKAQETHPINQVTNLIQFINDSLKHKSTILNNLIVGLLGGIVGAILTIIFSGQT